MPALFGLECPHLHCTRVHNKGLQRPTSPCVRAQLKIRASKRYARRPPCVRPRDARVGNVIRASKAYAGRPPPACAKDGHANMTRAKMHASPATCAPKMRASEAVTGTATWSRCLRSSSHVLPHDQEQREEGVWL